MIKYKIRGSDWLTFPLIIVNFNNFFLYNRPTYTTFKSQQVCWHLATDFLSCNSRYLDAFTWLATACWRQVDHKLSTLMQTCCKLIVKTCYRLQQLCNWQIATSLIFTDVSCNLMRWTNLCDVINVYYFRHGNKDQASKAFIASDVCGIKYICFLVPHISKLR